AQPRSWPGVDRSRPLAVDLDLDLTFAVDRREGAARLVVEGEDLAVLAGRPRPLPRATREGLRRRRHHPGPGPVGGPDRRHRLGQLAQGVDLAQLLLDRLLGRPVLALAEVGPGERSA